MKSEILWPSLLAAAGAALAGCAKPAAAPLAVPPVVVQVAPVVYDDAAIPVRATGVLARRAEAELAFKIGGLVEAVLVRAGDAVKQDQVLARLRLDEIDAQVAQARSGLEKARRDLGRFEKLEANRAATLENLQDARTAVEVAAAQLRMAEFNRRFAVITAPANGRILRRLVEPNELVAAGRAALGFASEAEGWLARVELADREAARIRPGDRAEITATMATAARLAGRVTQIAEAADAVTRTTPVEIMLEAAPAQLRSGSIVVATLEPARVEPRPVVPASALIEGAGQRASLFLLDDGARAARRVTVEIEAFLGAQAYLRTALPRKARVVISGGEYLRDGMPVEAKP